jgi:hypothetical protein
MQDVSRHPLLVLALSFAVLYFSAWLGASVLRRIHGHFAL